jgi:hypothetical protein
MSVWLALALAVIVIGGFAILRRLALLRVALGFWAAFAAGLAVVAFAGHAMSARWHLGPVTGWHFWVVLVTSPEVLVFLFFMITDPKTTPKSTRGRAIYAVSIGMLAVLLIAPARTEFWAKVGLLGALALVCLARPVVDRLVRVARARPARPAFVAAAAVLVYAGVVVAVGIPARPGAATAAPLAQVGRLPQITVLPSKGVSSRLDRTTARRIVADLVTDLRQRADRQRRLAAVRTVSVNADRLDRVRIWLEPGEGQGPPVAVAAVAGTRQVSDWSGSPPAVVTRHEPGAFNETIRLELHGSRYRIKGGAETPKTPAPVVSPETAREAAAGFAGVKLTDVASKVGLDFRQDAFRFGVTPDTPAMMGGGLCWLDYDNDGWLDLFVVNSYSEGDIGAWSRRGGMPRSQLFHNVHGRFVNVTAKSGAGLRVRGQGCVAADFNGDGYTDLFVSTASDDKLLWNNGNGTFTEGARSSGVVSFGWHSGAAVADVNGDGRPDLYVAGYTEANGPIPGSMAGFPTNHLGVRDELFLNEGNGPNGRARFREVGAQAGLDHAPYDHSLGAVFTDVNGDGRPDLYVANDEDPNRLYLNERGGPLGFHFVDAARHEGVADPNAGMGIADEDYTGDGRADLFITNSRGQTHAVYRSRGGGFTDARSVFAAALGRNYTGWGASFVDLNLDGKPDLVLANGAIPVTNLAKDAGTIQVLENLGGTFADAGRIVGIGSVPKVNGRGVAAADYDNDGQVDIAVNSVGGRLVLLHGTGAKGHWLEVSLGRFAPGAVVTAVLPDGRRLVQEVHAGSSYLSSEDPRAHFGLGKAARVAELTVRYPDGRTTRMAGVAADRIVSALP